MRIIYLLLINLLIISSCKVKQGHIEVIQTCASEPCSEKGKDELVDLYDTPNAPNTNDDIRFFAVKAHLIIAPNGATTASEALIKIAIEKLNHNFEGAGIQFKLDAIITRKSSIFYLNDIRNDKSKEDILIENIDVPQMINLYVIRTNNLLAGYTPVLSDGFEDYRRLNLNKVFLSTEALQQEATVAHEFGHFFSLQHTFGSSYLEGSTDELVSGSNCNDSGDFICDTPADPNGQEDCCKCSYIGTINDYGQTYAPLINNFMSYYKYCCRDSFTQGQLDAMAKFAKTYRDYLK